MKKNPFTISYFVCPECSTEIPLPRLKGKSRKKQHIKTLYCTCCRTERDFTEYPEKDYYKTMAGDILQDKYRTKRNRRQERINEEMRRGNNTKKVS